MKGEFKALEDLDTIVNIGGSSQAMARFGINATFTTRLTDNSNFRLATNH